MSIYIIRAIGTNMFKVGYTAGDPEKRLSQLQTGCPHKLEIYRIIDGAGREVEKQIADDLTDFSANGGGEWFVIAPFVLDRRLERFTAPERDISVEEFGRLEWEWAHRPPGEKDSDIVNEMAELLVEWGKWHESGDAETIKKEDYSSEEWMSIPIDLNGEGRE